MRVTNTIRKYIREKVEAKIMPKYEWEKAEAKRIREIEKDIETRAAEAAFAAAKAVYDEAKNYKDILDYDEESANHAYLGGYQPISPKDYCLITSVHKWNYRMEKEVNKIVDDIVVTLELGGNKADLDRMLSEL